MDEQGYTCSHTADGNTPLLPLLPLQPPMRWKVLEH